MAFPFSIGQCGVPKTISIDRFCCCYCCWIFFLSNANNYTNKLNSIKCCLYRDWVRARACVFNMVLLETLFHSYVYYFNWLILGKKREWFRWRTSKADWAIFIQMYWYEIPNHILILQFNAYWIVLLSILSIFWWIGLNELCIWEICIYKKRKHR